MLIDILEWVCTHMHAFFVNLTRQAQLKCHIHIYNGNISIMLLESCLLLCVRSRSLLKRFKHIIAWISASFKFIIPLIAYLVLVYFFVYHNEFIYRGRHNIIAILFRVFILHSTQFNFI